MQVTKHVAVLLIVALLGCTAGSGRDDQGGDGPAGPTDTAFAHPGEGELEFEAELFHERARSGDGGWRVVRSPRGFSGNGAMTVPARRAIDAADLDEAPRLDYRVHFERPGTYYLWVRGFSVDGGANSIYYDLADGNGPSVIEVNAYQAWVWSGNQMDGKRATIEVTEPGTTTLHLWPREAGMRVDKLLISDSNEFQPESGVVWASDFESGSLDEWSDAGFGTGCGGEYNNDGGTVMVTDEVSRSGSYSVKLTVEDVDGPQGARLSRRCTGERLYYSAWYYFPRSYRTIAGWWNIFQFKSGTPGQASDPLFTLNVASGRGGRMRLYLRDIEAARSYTQSVADIPVGQWFHIEAFLRSSADETGEVTIWQDGVEIISVKNVRTRFEGGDVRWYVNNYTEAIRPDPAIIYVDDAAISLSRVWEDPE